MKVRAVVERTPWLNTVFHYVLKAMRIIGILPTPIRMTYPELRKMLEKSDREYVNKNTNVRPLHNQLNRLREEQLHNWDSFVYCDGYFYQGLAKIGINGIKPTEARIDNYEIRNYFGKDKNALDIGSNSGFLTCHIAEYLEAVDGIELNPYLVNMGIETAKYLELSNVNFICADFMTHAFDEGYDLILSLSNHFTIDGNLNVGFEDYIKKIYSISNENALLFFESHSIKGADSDLDAKFGIASKYFDLIKYKMVRAYYPADIDKLFAVFRKRNVAGGSQHLSFRLKEAMTRYDY